MLVEARSCLSPGSQFEHEDPILVPDDVLASVQGG
jgi:hypothetical protein